MTREEVEAVMTSVRQGDLVEFTVRGVADIDVEHGLYVKSKANGRLWLTPQEIADEWQGSIEVISRSPLPPEPPRGSVVLDHSGYAYQRGQYTWEGATIHRSVSWESLNTYYGPVRVVYTPEEAS